MPKFYEYRQNNSGGFDLGPKLVFVRAESPEQANVIAEVNGLYFDGVAKGWDCSCCGDRWYKAWESDAYTASECAEEVSGWNKSEVRIIV